MIGTAMGTSFSVVYAIIFMIWLETPIMSDVRFSPYIRLYKRFIDDLFLIWTGPEALLCDLRRALARRDRNIRFEWSGYESIMDALDSSTVKAELHAQVNFLDLDMCLQLIKVEDDPQANECHSDEYIPQKRIVFRPYRKPGNAHAYIPFHSFHGRHIFRGWVLAELLRLLTHCSTLELWRAEGSIFYHHLCARGYPREFLRAVFQEVTWSRRSEVLTKLRQHKGNEFFKTYRACVLTLRNAPEWPMLKELLGLSLNELRESTFADIFPPRIFLAQSCAPRLGSILKR